MRDREKILLGTLIALGLLTLPFWWNAGRAQAAPQPDLDTPAIAALPVRECVESRDYMRANHMKLLYFWRDSVVRRNARAYVNTRGQEYEISLQKTCMHCHDSKARFCDECHNYVSVTMDCWNCHVAPEEGPERLSRDGPRGSGGREARVAERAPGGDETPDRLSVAEVTR